MNLKKFLFCFCNMLFILIISKSVYAKDNNYTIFPTKNINGKEVIYGINDKSNKVSKLINNDNFNTKEYTIKVFRNNEELNENQEIGTNDIVKFYKDNSLVKEYYILLYGDVVGNGKLSSIDSLAIVKNKTGKIKIYDAIYLEAGRISENKRINQSVPNSIDALYIVKHNLGRYEIVQDFNKDNNTTTPSWNEDNNNSNENANGNNNNDSNDNNNDNNNNNTNDNNNNQNDNTPVGMHGKLSVTGKNIVDKNANKFQLKGVSTHGIAWFPQYVNKDTFEFMRDEWGINTVRLAMYSDPNAGYSLEQHKVVKAGVSYATELGMYVIIDWHILGDGNPNTYKSQAINFFKEMATEYKDNNNVLYEICNEPNGDVKWDRDIKPYALEVIEEIRKIDDDAIIICGTPTWSQDVDIVSDDPITNYDNIVYTLHFYAGTHKQYLRDKAQTAINAGLPLFVSEFGISDASGNGYLDEEEGDRWIEFLNSNNISWLCWSLSNKNESSALISSNTDKVSDWNDDELSQEGRWLVRALKK